MELSSLQYKIVRQLENRYTCCSDGTIREILKTSQISGSVQQRNDGSVRVLNYEKGCFKNDDGSIRYEYCQKSLIQKPGQPMDIESSREIDKDEYRRFKHQIRKKKTSETIYQMESEPNNSHILSKEDYKMRLLIRRWLAVRVVYMV
jgi:hypothetical protein